MITLQEEKRGRILRMIPADGIRTVELTLVP